MKERIFSIMDMNKKKTGLSILCGVLTLTLGMSFTLAAKAETQKPPALIQEDIKEDLAFSYGLVPDPQIYSRYSGFGITISEDGQHLLYNGQRVRLFADEGSREQAFFSDDTGELDLAVTRNEDGSIAGIESISADKAQKYRSAFFADDVRAASIAQNASVSNGRDTGGKTKYDAYLAYGIELSADGETLYYNGERVKLLLDILSDGSAETYWTDESGTASLSVVRASDGQITGIGRISEEQAQEYRAALAAREKKALDGLEERVENQIKEMFPE